MNNLVEFTHVFEPAYKQVPDNKLGFHWLRKDWTTGFKEQWYIQLTSYFINLHHSFTGL